MDRRIFFSLMLFSFTLLFLYVIYSILSPFIVPLAWAFVLGIGTFPLYLRLRCRLHCNENVSAAIMTFLSVLTLVIPVVGLGFLITQEVLAAYHFISNLTEQGHNDLLNAVLQHPSIQPLVQRLQPYLDQFDLRIRETVLPAAKQGVTHLLGYTTGVVKNIFSFILGLVVMVITLFFIYRDGESFMSRVWEAFPLDVRNKEIIISTVKRVLSAVLYGVMLTCAVQGTLGGIGFWFTGLPSPALFGVMMAIAALIPVVGTALIWIPGGLALLLQGKMVMGIALLAWGGLVIGGADNVIRPLFISGKARIHILVTALGGIGGLAAFGFLGVVAGPLLLALFMDFFNIYVTEIMRQDRAPVTPER